MKYTLENILTERGVMDDFIHHLAYLDLDNMSGSVYRRVCLAYYKDGVLLQSNHHVDRTCRIWIVSDKNAKVRRGDSDSRYGGDAFPQIEGGKWVCVWNSPNEPMKAGPWVETVKAVIEHAITLAAMRVTRKENAERQEREAQQRKQSEFENQLEQNWKPTP